LTWVLRFLKKNKKTKIRTFSDFLGLRKLKKPRFLKPTWTALLPVVSHDIPPWLTTSSEHFEITSLHCLKTVQTKLCQCGSFLVVES